VLDGYIRCNLGIWYGYDNLLLKNNIPVRYDMRQNQPALYQVSTLRAFQVHSTTICSNILIHEFDHEGIRVLVDHELLLFRGFLSLQLLILLLLLLTMHNVSGFFYPCKKSCWKTLVISFHPLILGLHGFFISSIYKESYMTFFCPWTQDGLQCCSALELLHMVIIMCGNQLEHTGYCYE